MSRHVKLEETYQQLTELEHVKHRPDSFVGSCQNVPQVTGTFSFEHGLEYKEVPFVEGLLSIFDEPLVNAGDHKTRNPDTMTYLNVTMDDTKITFKNNGPGIPVQIHEETKQWLPEMIFGNMRTSSNYNDQEGQAETNELTGGRNGYGIKLTNIFSHKFEVQTTDAVTLKKFHMQWTDHMETKSTPKIKEFKPTDNPTPCTTIQFQPDMALFKGIDSLTDMHGVLAKRLLDLSGTCAGLTIKLNGQKMPVRNFKDYCSYVAKSMGIEEVGYIKTNSRWEIAVCASPEGEARNISFVNHISTDNGGTHVHYVRAAIEAELKARMEKLIGAKVPKSKIRNNLMLFLNTKIKKPAFGSQTKVELKTQSKEFGSKHGLSKKAMTKLFKESNIVQIIQDRAKGQIGAKAPTTAKSRRVDVPKLMDANWAGTKKSRRCRLFLAEGDSAKTLAVSGREKAGGPDVNGIYPLRGKLFNPDKGAKPAPLSIVAAKPELLAITKALNLKPWPFDYAAEGTTSLRYGQLVIMVDQDTDGAHIAGLIMFFLKWYNKSILEIDFLAQFITPVLKAKKGKETKSFFSMNTYNTWATSADVDVAKYQIKYYKGLGTSTPKEAKEYFSDLRTHLLAYEHMNKDAAARLDVAFSGRCKLERKEWISTKGGAAIREPDFESRPRRYAEFLDSSVMEYCDETILRQIPGMADGLKEVQRKILFGMFSKKVTAPIKVSKAAALVGGVTTYHHGETSMYDAIVGMAQSFVGKNNVALLFPDGQFGTRLLGGNDAASPRYIFTRLASIARLIFPEADDPVLDYLHDEGQRIEPRSYAPVLPMVLVNGACGIATGWSTNLPMYNPKSLINYLLDELGGVDHTHAVHPWYRGFTGTVVPVAATTASYRTKGVYEFGQNYKVRITELPIGKWTTPYIEKMKNMKENKTKAAQFVVAGYKDNSSDIHVEIVFTIQPHLFDMYKADTDRFEKDFELTTDLSMANIHLLDTTTSQIKKYTTFDAIIKDFMKFRLDVYTKRKAYQLDALAAQVQETEHKITFIRGVVDESVPIRKVSKKTTTDAMVFKGIPVELHDKFLAMAISSLHTNRVAALEKSLVDLRETQTRLRTTSVKNLWRADLRALRDALATKKPTKRKVKAEAGGGGGGVKKK